MKYQILHDYGTEGFKFYEEQDFDTVAEAVKFALELGYCTPFVIVQIIEWKAEAVTALTPKE